MEKYDEDITENVFFQKLTSEFDNFQREATTNKWMVCVPRDGCFTKNSITTDHFLNHILVPYENDGTLFRTLSGKEIVIQNNMVITGEEFHEQENIHILFEETFYVNSSESFKILCISRTLETGGDDVDSKGTMLNIYGLKDCSDVLWHQIGDRKILHQIDTIIENWNKMHSNLEFEQLQVIRDSSGALYTHVMQVILKDSKLKKKLWGDKFLMSSLKLAVETYTLHGIYKKLIKGISANLARDDSKLNKVVRNLSDLQLKDLNVKPEFIPLIPRARQELMRLVWYTTPLDKLECLKKAVTSFTLSKLKSGEGAKTVLSTDDLLPILVFLVLKVGIPNWLAHLMYMKIFRLSRPFDAVEKGEYAFYVASLEAAIEHIRSGILLGPSSPECLLDQNSTSIVGSPIFSKMDLSTDSNSSSVNAFFEHVRTGQTKEIEKILKKNRNTLQQETLNLCHPLCSCDNCEQQQRRSRCDTTPTISSRDDRGYTALHIAAQFGQDLVVDILISNSSDVNATDYHGCTPLHLACLRGHQNSTLLLLHHGANVNVVDNDGNTPLHLCAVNGHEDCVKALLYYDEHKTRSSIQINATNDNGDTPLHHAAKWGYDEIVQSLLDYGACVEAKNKKNQTPLDCAHNVNVTRLLLKAVEEAQAIGNCGFIKIENPCPPAEIPELSTSRGKQINSRKAEDIKKINKLMKAISVGDVKLACYYLNIDNESELTEEEPETKGPKELCHPLCQCEKCRPMQKITPTLKPGLQDLDLNTENEDGQTPLHVACLYGQTPLVRVFLRRGANMNSPCSKGDGFSPLHFACFYNRTEVVNLLLKYDALVNITDREGCTPLHLVCRMGSVSLAELLIKNHACVNLSNHKGNTPLHEAIEKCCRPLVELLVKNGASTTVTNKDKLSPRDLAHDTDVLQLLGAATNPVSSSPPNLTDDHFSNR